MKHNYLIFLIFIFEISCFQPLNGQVPDYKKYSNPVIEKSDAFLKGNTYQKDFLLFISILQECHPAFAPGSNYPFNVDSVKQSGYQWSRQCQSVNSLWGYMQSVITLLKDGHTTLMNVPNNNFLYPVAYFYDSQGLYVIGINKEYESSLGKQIIKINGHPVDEVINSFRSLISSDNDVYFKNRVTNFIQVYSNWQYTPYCLPDSSLQLTFTDATSTSIRPITKSKLNIVSQAKTKSGLFFRSVRSPFQYKLLPKEDICYFQFNACVDQNSIRRQYLQQNPAISEKDLEKVLSQYQKFDTFLEEMFQSIQENKIGTLVIDVRNNGGGNSGLCDELLAWLKPVKNTISGHYSIRFSELWKQSYPCTATQYEQLLAGMQQSLEMGKLYSQTGPSRKEELNKNVLMNNDDKKIFKGKVIFIQSNKTLSSAGLLITAATDNNIGIVIGDRSSYKPCHYGDLLYWELPGTKIKGSVSHKIFIRPNSDKCGEECLTPDVYLSPVLKDVLDGKDICLEWILKNHKNLH
jgi:hypothetical protein